LKITIRLFILLSFCCILSCADKAESDWTILVYMAADNGLNFAALDDIQEMTMADFSEDINVIVQIDESVLSDDPTAKRYKVSAGQLIEIANLGEIDSGDYNTLTAFTNWGFDNYQSRRKALFIWGHGNGWYHAYNKFLPDNQSSSAINIPAGEFAAALDNMKAHLDILILDACNMMTIEVVSEIYQFTDYIIGAETIINTNGFPYDEVLTIWENYTTVQVLVDELALVFANSYMPSGSQNPYSDQFEISIAAVQTSNFPALQSKITEFADLVENGNHYQSLNTARNECAIVFNDFSSDVDLKDLFTRLAAISADEDLRSLSQEILLLIDNVFTSYYYIDLGDPGFTQNYPAGTATIWFPVSEQIYQNVLPQYLQLDFATTGWQNVFGFNSSLFASGKK
jgi:hypothetical protein